MKVRRLTDSYESRDGEDPFAPLTAHGRGDVVDVDVEQANRLLGLDAAELVAEPDAGPQSGGSAAL